MPRGKKKKTGSKKTGSKKTGSKKTPAKRRGKSDIPDMTPTPVPAAEVKDLLDSGRKNPPKNPPRKRTPKSGELDDTQDMLNKKSGTPYEGTIMQLLLRPTIVDRIYKVKTEDETPEQVAEIAVETGLRILEQERAEKATGNLVEDDASDEYDPDFEQAHQEWFGRM